MGNNLGQHLAWGFTLSTGPALFIGEREGNWGVGLLSTRALIPATKALPLVDTSTIEFPSGATWGKKVKESGEWGPGGRGIHLQKSWEGMRCPSGPP